MSLAADPRPTTSPLTGTAPTARFVGGSDACPALVADGVVVTHGQLRAQVEDRLAALGLETRSLVVLAGETSLEFVVTYLALLHGGHVPLLAGAHEASLAERWDASALAVADADGWRIEHRHRRPLDLHPDLALLLTTSGSTGAPKLVRLSHENLIANATSIVDYLELDPDDVGITSLPLHYCYGLSVLHSHLLAGASVVLTRASVVDPCFAAAMRDHGVTNLAGVPHTFTLLERAGPDRIAVPTLRFVTQAGGRMSPDHVSAWARRVERWGAQWFTMYGQTEATARMAYVPPERILEAPHAIGVAVPGGDLSLRIDDETRAIGPDVGELIYRGANVMLGYATSVDDLARGRDVTELATGDLARRCDHTGMFTLVGRRSRFVKPFGVRVDLDDLGRRLREHLARTPSPSEAMTAVSRASAVSATVASGASDASAGTCGADAAELVVVGDDDGVVVVAPAAVHDRVVDALRTVLAMPERVWRVVDVEVPRTAAGKVAAADLLAAVRATDAMTDASPAPPASPGNSFEAVAAVYRSVLGRRTVRGEDTFVSLGGDSLSYVECSIRLEAVLGTLPKDWHLVRVDAFGAPRRRRFVRRLDTSVLLRTAGILAVVATHMGIAYFPGGAHLMLGVVGYNVSRFLLDVEPLRERRRAATRAVARVAVPTALWALAGVVLFGAYSAGTVLLVNNYVGPRSHADDHWHFWFVEVLVHLTVIAIALSAVPALRSFDRRHRYLAPLAVLALTLVLRMEWAWMDDFYNLRYRTHGVAFFFVLGWLVHRSDTLRTKAVTTAVCAASVVGFFDRPQREWFIVAGLVLLLWCRQVILPSLLVRPVALLAAASMWIYLSHFTFWPLLTDVVSRETAYVLTLLAGVTVWAIARAAEPPTVRFAGRVLAPVADRLAGRFDGGRAGLGRDRTRRAHRGRRAQRGQAATALPG